MSSLADLKGSETEKFKWRRFTGKMYCSSLDLYNDRFFPYMESYRAKSLCVLDLLHMKKKKFVIELDPELLKFSYAPSKYINMMLTDLHTVIIPINQKTNNGESLETLIMLHLDYDNSTATFKRPLVQVAGLDLVLLRHSFKYSNSCFEYICYYKGQNLFKKFSVHKASYLNDREIEETKTQQIELSKALVIVKVVYNNVYGFWINDVVKMDYSNLVHVCLETKKETTLKVSGWPTDLQRRGYGPAQTTWVGRTLVVNTINILDKKNLLVIINLDSLHCRELDVQFEFRISRLFSNYANTLVVETISDKFGLRSYYRFNFNRPDTLVNLSRYAMKQYSPTLQDAIKYVPNQFKRPFTE